MQREHALSDHVGSSCVDAELPADGAHVGRRRNHDLHRLRADRAGAETGPAPKRVVGACRDGRAGCGARVEADRLTAREACW